ncbi:HAMP domain-containing protein [Sneathiella sp. P13V-1]|uniref:methyl-accepting chemotaxis protein n=1 Tax=Sneathiella sp. P13V-1 TaxID=2697366 RepID=UPI00187B5C89|nr:cache domain-containing protein [Sneathiella sp. P13V-1]MBE7637877.1 HAMP domain-containing protein [Sneathiella sp. P13V-1]
MLGSIKIGVKLLIIAIASLIGIALIGTVGSMSISTTLYQDREETLRNIIESNLSIVAHYHKLASSGALTEEDAKTRALSSIEAVRYNETDYLWINDLDGKMLMHPIAKKLVDTIALDLKDTNGKFIFKEIVRVAKESGSGTIDYYWPKPGSEEPVEKLSYVQLFKPWGWVLGTGVYIDDLTEARNAHIVQTVITAGVLLAVIAIVSLLFARDITAPLNRITANIKKLTDGERDFADSDTDRSDELGVLANAVSQFRENAKKMDAMAEEQAQMKLRQAEEAQRQAEEKEKAKRREIEKEEEARREAEAERKQAMLELANTFEINVLGIVDSVSTSSTTMCSTAETMTGNADDASNRSNVVANAAAGASTNVQAVASATEELSSSIAEISSQVSRSANISTRAVEQANKTGDAMSSLQGSTGRIGEVITLINDIAGQTNLLALNATIEAARAGDAGKGFAVVASEVKSLANQTAKATEEISNQISSLQSETESMSSAITEISETIREINEIGTAIASAVEEQGAATAEISRNAQSAAQSSNEVTQNITVVKQSSSETGSAANEVLTAAQLLSQQSNELREQVSAFLSNIKTG